jgi:hypothetical protein
MELNVGKELAALNRMPVSALRAKYVEVFGEATNARHKAWLVKRIIWRMQALAEGDLTERARRRAAELANDADLRRRPPKTPTTPPPAPLRPRAATVATPGDHRLPVPGTVLTRVYKGETLTVSVLPAGFEFEGEVYKSLSAVAKKITGSHCNGYLFFRLTKQGGDR